MDDKFIFFRATVKAQQQVIVQTSKHKVLHNLVTLRFCKSISTHLIIILVTAVLQLL